MPAETQNYFTLNEHWTPLKGLGHSRRTDKTLSSDRDLILKYFSKDISRIPLLTPEQEVILAKAYERPRLIDKLRTELRRNPTPQEIIHRIGRGPTEWRIMQVKSNDARVKLEESNLRLVISVAKVATFPYPHMELADSVQNGYFGLQRAVEKYEWRKGNKFSTYATWWIRKFVADEAIQQGATVRFPIERGRAIQKMSFALKDMLEQHINPTIEEFVTRAGIEGHIVKLLMPFLLDPISLDQEDPNDDDSVPRTGYDVLIAPVQATSSPPSDPRKRQAVRDIVMQVDLTPRQQIVIRRLFGLDDGQCRSIEEVARELGVAAGSIKGIQKNALAKLRHPSNEPYFAALLHS
jgi:RNA polymerase primary sigma factor